MKMIPGAVLAAIVMLAGCATDRHATVPAGGAERLTIAVGACYGTCPVYTVALDPDGAGRFDGKAHVASPGLRAFRADMVAQGDLMAALAPFRPRTGTTAQTRCDQQVSDQPTYTITWTGRDGRSTTLNHDRGCGSPRNSQLNAVLKTFPDTLRIRALIGRPGSV